MTEATPNSTDAGSESSDQLCGDGAGDADDAAADHGRGRRSVPPGLQADVLERDNHQCQVCGRCGPTRGGVATLHVHHMQRDPDGIDVNAMANLTTLCRACHNWVHQRALPDEVPVTVTDADMTELSPTDIEIVQFLAAEGPAGTGAVRDAVTAELSLTSVREHLERLMALDNLVESRDDQLVDRDRDTGRWGLPVQIDVSARGHVPADHREFAQRFEDEQVRRALDDGHDRETVAAVLDVSPRSTYHKYKRAYAYEFPIDEFRRSGSGGQHPQAAATDDPSSERAEESPAAGHTDADPGRDADAGEQPGTDGDETGGVNQAGRVDDVASADYDGAGSGSEPVGVSDIDPELIRMVNEAIIEHLSGDD